MPRFTVWKALAAFACIVFDASRVPAQTFTYEKFGGCEDVLLYASNRTNTEAIVVRADRKALALDVGATTILLAETQKGLEVRVHMFAEPLSVIDYCTDAVREPRQKNPTETMVAFSGEVTITLSEQGDVKDPKPFTTAQPFMYQATVSLRDLVFKKQDGSTVTMKGPCTLTAAVGYYWG